MSGLATVILALVFPADYDWAGTRAIKTIADDEPPVDRKLADEETRADQDEKSKDNTEVTVAMASDPLERDPMDIGPEENDQYLDRDELQRVFKRATIISGSMAFIITIVCPSRVYLSWMETLTRSS